MEALRIENLSKNFGGLEAVSDVSLSVEAGTRRAIIGPNGAGKTTLFNLIAGELPPSRGSVYLFGREITNMPLHRRTHEGLARTFQINNLFPNLSVLDNVLRGITARQGIGFRMFRPIGAYKDMYEKAARLLQQSGLWEKRNVPVKALAYGEQRHMEIILALSSDPRILLLDEPTAGLSSEESKAFSNAIVTLGGDVTILIIAHDLDLVFELADGITVLHYGQVIAEGTGEEIQAHPKVKEIYLGSEEEIEGAAVN
ncbi:ABC transporter ATP-binding protein [Thermodesulfobacteriota bacterium]